MKRMFERLVGLVLTIYGHPVTFLMALAAVTVFFFDRNFQEQSLHEIIRDLMFCITFLSFFLIQKAVNKYTAALHIKMNELVSAHEKARNELGMLRKKPKKK